MTANKFHARVGSLEMTLTDDGQKGRLRVEVPGANAPVTVAFDAGPEDLDNIILELAKLRTHLKPERYKTPVPKNPVGYLAPPWCAADDVMTGGANLNICHPGFGWLSFQLPKQEAGRLGDLLARIARQADHAGPKN